MKTNESLRRYVDDRSESAFEELVKQHVDLVYSAALRQVNGNVSAAQDVTQAVFTDLARKAPRLTQHTWLPGWLYTSTRYLAAKAIRAEQCRRSYEQEAHEMNQILQSPDSGTNWLELRPLLDAAMHDLSPADREAVLMRYFEHLSLAEIGARLGLKANAANMRIERAVDRLRAALAKRGVTSTLGALAATLTSRAVGAAPAGLAKRASTNAIAAEGTTGGLSWTVLKLAGLMKGNAFIAASAAVVVAALIVVPKWLSTGTSAISATPSLSAPTMTPTPTLAAASQSAARAVSSSSGQATEGITLMIVADDTGQPVPGVTVGYYPANKTGPRSHMPTLLGVTEEGKCVIPLSHDEVASLAIESRNDGYADTSALWIPGHGEDLPRQYTLRLTRSQPIAARFRIKMDSLWLAPKSKSY
jgi:RNA polymerase sigma factor (sigma-70 family)